MVQNGSPLYLRWARTDQVGRGAYRVSMELQVICWASGHPSLVTTLSSWIYSSQLTMEGKDFERCGICFGTQLGSRNLRAHQQQGTIFPSWWYQAPTAEIGYISFWGLPNKKWWLKTAEMSSLMVWRPKVQNQSVGRATPPSPGSGGEAFLVLLLAAGGCWQRGGIFGVPWATAISLQSLPRSSHHPLCVCLFVFSLSASLL